MEKGKPLTDEQHEIVFVMTVVIRGDFEQFSEAEGTILRVIYELQKKGIHVQMSGQEVTR